MIRISEAEAVVMEVLWSQHPLSADEVIARLPGGNCLTNEATTPCAEGGYEELQYHAHVLLGRREIGVEVNESHVGVAA